MVVEDSTVAVLVIVSGMMGYIIGYNIGEGDKQDKMELIRGYIGTMILTLVGISGGFK